MEGAPSPRAPFMQRVPIAPPALSPLSLLCDGDNETPQGRLSPEFPAV